MDVFIKTLDVKTESALFLLQSLVFLKLTYPLPILIIKRLK